MCRHGQGVLTAGCSIGQKTERSEQGTKPHNGTRREHTNLSACPIQCIECPAPTYSFLPEAERCSACPRNGICNGWYVLPKPGTYQSHPRSPQASADIHTGESMQQTACMNKGAIATWSPVQGIYNMPPIHTLHVSVTLIINTITMITCCQQHAK